MWSEMKKTQTTRLSSSSQCVPINLCKISAVERSYRMYWLENLVVEIITGSRIDSHEFMCTREARNDENLETTC